MLKSWITALMLAIALILTGCSTAVSGLQQYVDSFKGYEFLYPNGWVPVEVQEASEGVDLVFRDIIERTENLSVVISGVPQGKDLASLGTPTDIGYRFLKQTNAIAPEGRETEFIRAGSYEDIKGHPHYILEYAVELPDGQQRHNIASVAVSRNKLFTFNISTSEQRWQKVSDRFEAVAKSFTVY
ncbi:MAG: photosystem II reaction center PsbP [Jaaginema sp. PMC 1079.18]|nr:photosystem II reaction center PsbP [Jaaginema sp. PMC 1080.18]MEC4850766.1 photosystem II reaction center PsbP [Jaaginema sp. PMC 1079.18]MEC4866993.1 photosystem II reaction center PsbP [Jaaginema sp. PMC 1078.18]